MCTDGFQLWIKIYTKRNVIKRQFLYNVNYICILQLLRKKSWKLPKSSTNKMIFYAFLHPIFYPSMDIGNEEPTVAAAWHIYTLSSP